MAVELAGIVRINGVPGGETRVRVEFEGETLRLRSGQDLLGEWSIRGIGIQSLNEGFLIRAEGEEFVLITEDDAALAEAMDLKAVSPRLAKQVAARHKPEERPLSSEPAPDVSRAGPIAFALAGALVLVGATLLRSAGAGSASGPAQMAGGPEFWLGFTIGGVLMIATAYILAIGARWGRPAAIFALLLITILFGLAVSDGPTDAAHLTAYGFLAGGVVVGVAVLFGGFLEDRP